MPSQCTRICREQEQPEQPEQEAGIQLGASFRVANAVSTAACSVVKSHDVPVYRIFSAPVCMCCCFKSPPANPGEEEKEEETEERQRWCIALTSICDRFTVSACFCAPPALSSLSLSEGRKRRKTSPSAVSASSPRREQKLSWADGVSPLHYSRMSERETLESVIPHCALESWSL